MHWAEAVRRRASRLQELLTDTVQHAGWIGEAGYDFAQQQEQHRSNLDTRLKTVCDNMKTQGITIYTIGVSADGQSNTILDSDCPSTINGKVQYYPAGPPVRIP